MLRNLDSLDERTPEDHLLDISWGFQPEHQRLIYAGKVLNFSNLPNECKPVLLGEVEVSNQGPASITFSFGAEHWYRITFYSELSIHTNSPQPWGGEFIRRDKDVVLSEAIFNKLTEFTDWLQRRYQISEPSTSSDAPHVGSIGMDGLGEVGLGHKVDSFI
jgi:hypothetical protein